MGWHLDRRLEKQGAGEGMTHRWEQPKQAGMKQPLLAFGHPAARSRVGDPPTSTRAALLVERSGAAHTQREKVLRGVILHRGWTSAELARTLGMERHQPARRLKELEESGLVDRGEARECRATNRECLTWWPSAWTLEMLAQGWPAEELIARKGGVE